jgi:hypothetical protein
MTPARGVRADPGELAACGGAVALGVATRVEAEGAATGGATLGRTSGAAVFVAASGASILTALGAPVACGLAALGASGATSADRPRKNHAAPAATTPKDRSPPTSAQTGKGATAGPLVTASADERARPAVLAV